jgi:radical SAM superfamily enzyme YgiQ (UPF0313 family)
MAEIWMFNGISKRRRSVSDCFLENGLAALRGHIEANGHSVRIIDWATEDGFAELSPTVPARMCRSITATLLKMKQRGASRLPVFLLFVLSLLLQTWQDIILHFRLKRRIRKLVQEAKTDGVRLFGIKVWYGEAFEWAEQVCREFNRRSPDTVMIAGGHQVTMYREEFLARTSFDLAIAGQGELPLTQLLDIAERTETGTRFNKKDFMQRAAESAEAGELKNVIYRSGDTITAAGCTERLTMGIHLPSYTADKQGKVRIHVLIEGLGCPWGKCNFCTHGQFYEGFKTRPLDTLYTEMEHMRGQGVGLFRFAGSDTPPWWGRTIADGILERGLVIEFSMFSRAVKGIGDADVFAKTVDAYEVMIRAGLRAVFIGGESGHPWVNSEVMNKGIHPGEVAGTIRALRTAEQRVGRHVDISLALIYPVPTLKSVSQEEVFDADMEFVKQCSPDSVMITPPGPFIGTSWNQDAERFGFELAPDWIDRMIRYEYVMYKPPFMWKRLPIRLDGMPFRQGIALSMKLNAAIRDLGIPTNLTDEHFLMMRTAGMTGVEGACEFKRQTMLDIISGDYRYIRQIAARVNRYSLTLAETENIPEQETGPLHAPVLQPAEKA